MKTTTPATPLSRSSVLEWVGVARAIPPDVRVGLGAFAPRPLSEPDLWVTHTALWVSVSEVEQECLTRGQFRERIQVLPRRSQ